MSGPGSRAESGGFSAHPTALVAPGARVGAGSRVWAFCNLLDGAVVGRDCQICDRVFIEGGASVGDRVTIKCGVSIWTGVHLGDDVFVGPGVVFTNDPAPRSGRHLDRYPQTRVERGASLGAGAILLPGVKLGEFCFVGAGALVTHDVAPYQLALGQPARPAGWVCECAQTLEFSDDRARCATCGREYSREGDSVRPLVPEAPPNSPNRG